MYLVPTYEEGIMNMRKRTNLEVKFDDFRLSMESYWLHQVRATADLQGHMKILIGLVSGLAAFVVGVWVVEIMK